MTDDKAALGGVERWTIAREIAHWDAAAKNVRIQMPVAAFALGVSYGLHLAMTDHRQELSDDVAHT